MDFKWKDMIVSQLMNYLQNDLMFKSVIINASMIAAMFYEIYIPLTCTTK